MGNLSNKFSSLNVKKKNVVIFLRRKISKFQKKKQNAIIFPEFFSIFIGFFHVIFQVRIFQKKTCRMYNPHQIYNLLPETIFDVKNPSTHDRKRVHLCTTL